MKKIYVRPVSAVMRIEGSRIMEGSNSIAVGNGYANADTDTYPIAGKSRGWKVFEDFEDFDED